MRIRVSPKEDRTRDGIVFASKLEMERYCVLKLYEKCGVISGLELQPRFDIVVNKKPCGFYKADFRYTEAGKVIIEDVKGSKKGAAYVMFRLKKKIVEALYGIKIVETTK